MDCFGTYFTHVQTCDVTRVQTATEWTASVHTSHRMVRKTAGVRKAGTQQLDRIWHHVKKCIPGTFKNRDPQGYLNQKDFMQYVHRWQWRRSCDSDLFTSLGQACKKLHR